MRLRLSKGSHSRGGYSAGGVRRLATGAMLVGALMVVTPVGVTVAPAPAAADPPANCKLLAPVGVYNEHEGPTDYNRWLTPSGTLNVAVLFTKFNDTSTLANERTDRIAQLSSEVSDWVNDSSYGQVSLNLQYTSGWNLINVSQQNYVGYGSTFNAHRDYLEDAIDAADASVNFSTVDIVYVVVPKSASVFTNSPAFIASPGWGVTEDGVELRHGVTFGQDIDYWGYKVANHETGHLFGLPDLYSYAGGAGLHASVGGWDIMGLINGPAPDHFGWHKWKMDWLDDSQVTCETSSSTTTTETLTPLGSSSGIKMVVIKTGSRRAVVVENRQSSDLDVTSSCFQPGALAYVVDSSVGGGNGPIKVLDRTPGSTLGGCHADHAQLDNATLTTVGHQVTDSVSGVTVELTAISGSNLEVEVTW